MIDYQAIKRLAKEEGVSIRDMIALAPNNDPFYTGSKAELAMAEWFAELWQRLGCDGLESVHLRRVHYRAISQDRPTVKPNGKVYENTKNDWRYLCNAGKYARYLNLVSPTAFVDRRNPDAMIFTDWNPDYINPTPCYRVPDDCEWGLYTLPELPELDSIGHEDVPELPGWLVYGYSGIQQDYHLEVWVEKTTANDVLEPLCRRYGVNLVTGAGEMSITAVVDFMKRMRESRRPARILYVSDYDPAGLGMPISVARKIEFFQRRNDNDELDIRLYPIVLTSEQVREYDLPRVPVKDKDKRKANWERDHGAGQVELDALEALHKGALARIVEDALLDYYDPDLESKARKVCLRLMRDLRAAQDAGEEAHEADITSLENDYQELRDDFEETRERFAGAIAVFTPEIEGYGERLEEIVIRGESLYNTLYGELAERLDDIDIDDYPLPETSLPPENDGALYISQRDYTEQLGMYKSYRHNKGGRNDG